MIMLLMKTAKYFLRPPARKPRSGVGMAIFGLAMAAVVLFGLGE